MHHRKDRTAHTTAFCYTSREVNGDRSDDSSHHERTLYHGAPFRILYRRVYLTTHSTHFIYGYMVMDHSENESGNLLPPMGYSFRIAAMVLLYASSHRQDNTYHGLCYTSRGALAGTRNSSMGPTWRIDPTTHRTMSERSYHGTTSRSPYMEWIQILVFSKGK